MAACAPAARAPGPREQELKLRLNEVTPTIPRIAKPCQDADRTEEEALASLADRKPVSGDPGPPAGAPPDLVAPTCPQDTKPQATSAFISTNRQWAPEFLDPRTLRLLWGQRELEIQALRWAVQGSRNGRHSSILQEVTGRPPKRSTHGREKLLQDQVQKLTLELKEQKERAQLEEHRLEERLLQATSTLQQLEAELQAFQKSCLLQLAQSSWVGRVLRSQTGSVEVVTAETLVTPSDSSENELTPTAREAFRLEDVDWNSIAHRYPNLLTKFYSEHTLSQTLPQGRWDAEAPHERVRGQQKSVEWSTLPRTGTTNSGGSGSGSDTGSCRLAQPSLVRKVTGRPPQGLPGSSQEQAEAQTRTSSGDASAGPEGLLCQDRYEARGEPCTTARGPQPSARPESRPDGCCESPAGSCLKIVAVSRREKFVRVLNQSREETADLGGSVLQQLERDFPVCLYRFPPGTLLPPRHHVTVWGEGTGSTKKRRTPLGSESVRHHSSWGCVTLLLNPTGEVLSEHQAPHCVTPVSRIFADNTDLSIDRFPLSEAGLGADEQRRRSRPLRKSRARAAGQRPRTRAFLPLLSANKRFLPREASARGEGAETEIPEPLPAIQEAGPGLDHRQARKEHAVCRASVDRRCPMVALSVQSSAESKFGFRFLSCPPIAAGPCARL